MENALLLLVLIPAIGAIVTAALPADNRPLIRWWALGASLLTAFVALMVAMRFEWMSGPGEEIRASLSAFYLESIGFGFKFGADTITLWLPPLPPLPPPPASLPAVPR